VVFWHF